MLLWGVVVPRRGTKKSPQPIRAEAMVGIKGGLGRPEVTCQSLRPSDPTQVPQAIWKKQTVRLEVFCVVVTFRV